MLTRALWWVFGKVLDGSRGWKTHTSHQKGLCSVLSVYANFGHRVPVNRLRGGNTSGVPNTQLDT